jgi:hypothetical protein
MKDKTIHREFNELLKDHKITARFEELRKAQQNALAITNINAHELASTLMKNGKVMVRLEELRKQ